MKACLLRAPAPVSTNPLALSDVPAPQPSAGQVLVRVSACGVCRTDLHVVEGELPPRKSPVIPGHQVVGVVEQLGEDSRRFRVGERVGIAWLHETDGVCEYCRSGKENLCAAATYTGYMVDGGYAEYAVAPARAVFPLPGPEWHDAAAAGQIVFTTAWHMLMTRAQLRAGETVVVSASGSGVGHAAVQIAKLAGATVVATAGSDEKLARSREDGADHVVNYGKDDVTAQVLDFTGGRGADIVIEHVGGEQFGACLNALRKNGRLITCGGHAGEVVDFDLIPLFRNEWSVIGSRTGTVRETELVMNLITAGKLTPRIHATPPLSEAAEAQRMIEEREHFGKVILRP